MPKILVLDIETKPALAYVWGLFDQNIGLNQIVEVGSVICFAAKWYDERKVMFHSDHHDGHEAMIEEVRSTGAAIRLITDGDVAGVIHCAEAEITGIDMYMGSGGAPEGVLAASALKCMGGQIYGQLIFRNDDEKARALKAGITDLNRIYTRDEMVTADVIFAATGVTQGSILSGIKIEPGWVTTETILMRSKTGSVRRMTYKSPLK